MSFFQDHGGEHAPTSPSLCSISFLIPGFLSWSPNLSSLSYFPACELFIYPSPGLSSQSLVQSLQHPNPQSSPQSQSLFLSPFLSLQGSWSSDTFPMTSHLFASACFLCL